MVGLQELYLTAGENIKVEIQMGERKKNVNYFLKNYIIAYNYIYNGGSLLGERELCGRLLRLGRPWRNT